MTTNTAQVAPPNRQDPRQVTNTLKKTFTFSDANASTGINFDNSIPVGAFITGCWVSITTVFNASSTNVLTVGTNSTTFNNLVAAGDVDELTVGTTNVTRGLGPSLAASADVTPVVKYTQTGTPGTTGVAVILITYEGGWVS